MGIFDIDTDTIDKDIFKIKYNSCQATAYKGYEMVKIRSRNNWYKSKTKRPTSTMSRRLLRVMLPQLFSTREMYSRFLLTFRASCSWVISSFNRDSIMSIPITIFFTSVSKTSLLE